MLQRAEGTETQDFTLVTYFVLLTVVIFHNKQCVFSHC